MQPAYRLYSELQWLPRPLHDFSKQLNSLKDPGRVAGGDDFRSLASYALNLSQLVGLASVIDRSRNSGRSLAPLVPFRLAILSNSTVELIVPAVIASAARHGIALEIIRSHFDQVAQEALAIDSKLSGSRPDAVLLALDYRALALTLSLGDAETTSTTVREALGYLQVIRTGIRSNSNAVCIFQTLAPPAELLFGGLDRVLPGTLRNLIDNFNRELATYVRGSGDVLLDVATLAETVGLAEWHNTSLWNLGRFAFSDELIPLYSDHVARTVAAICGKSRKVLILDLDNVLWGGVIGDDGLTGIQIAQGDPRGEAHLAVQRLALGLRKRGIVLAVSSKNADEVARLPFSEHPEMLLRLEHFAVFQANWQDKATNIQAIANELALGLDSMVFLDDNPVERGLVRKLLPQLAVPELPKDPALYTRTLTAAGYFETTAFTVEDLQRAGSYEHDAKRATMQQQIVGVDAYLTSLDMTITFQAFDAIGRARIVQLINKSNQYNLTGRRYTYHEIHEIENAHDVFTLQVRLADIFGDNGMISVVICRPGDPGVWDIDTWLMSCRVLGRRVEHMVLREILRHAKLCGIAKLIGTYIPTTRNTLVADHYAKLGFTHMDNRESPATRWELLVNAVEPEGAPMKVVSLGFAGVQ